MPSSAPSYGDDLAYIHDTGFGSFARHAVRRLLAELRRLKLREGRMIELGCGSGISSAVLASAGYDVLGYDLSKAMVRLARKRVPDGEFRVGSFLAAELPPCIAVTAIGEVFNYLFDRRNTQAQLTRLFRRVHRALQPGGLFMFDGAEPGRIVGGGRRRYGLEGSGWACLVDAEEDPRSRILTRRITSFRKVGPLFRREHEVHRLRLFDRPQIVAELRALGFRVRTLRSYGELKFPPGYVAFLCRKEG